MGTRHLICIVYNGKFVVAQYGQWDGYWDGQGAEIVKFLLVSENIKRLRDGLEFIYSPTEEDIERFNKEVEEETIKRRTSSEPKTMDFFSTENSPLNVLYPSLSRDTSSKILGIIASATKDKKIPIQKSLTFANDSLFCEYAYVIDLDNNVLECYHGSQNNSFDHRFQGVGGPGRPVPSLAAEFSFEELSRMGSEKEFIKAMAAKEDEEDE